MQYSKLDINIKTTTMVNLCELYKLSKSRHRQSFDIFVRRLIDNAITDSLAKIGVVTTTITSEQAVIRLVRP